MVSLEKPGEGAATLCDLIDVEVLCIVTVFRPDTFRHSHVFLCDSVLSEGHKLLFLEPITATSWMVSAISGRRSMSEIEILVGECTNFEVSLKHDLGNLDLDIVIEK